MTVTQTQTAPRALGRQALPRSRDGPRQGGLAGGVRRRRHRRGSDRTVGFRSRRARATAARTRIAPFWDKAIAPTDRLEFNFRETFQCGNEEANVGNIVTTIGGYQVITEGVFTYRVNDEGKLVALRAYWEIDRAVATARPV